MDKKYTVFISSTYEDLKDERSKVIDALLKMDCFPVGMEYFNAADESQWEVIKSLILECDYYVLIIAGRYGSIESESGKSYTQKEYEFAIENNIPIISFLHGDIENLPACNVEKEGIAKEKLNEFRKVASKKLCRFWKNTEELTSNVILSLTNLKKTKPATGWIRADKLSTADADKEILRLKNEIETLKENIRLKDEIDPIGIEQFAQGEDLFSLKIEYRDDAYDYYTTTIQITWNQIVKTIAPLMLNESDESKLKESLQNYIQTIHAEWDYVEILEDDFQTIKVQLIALQIIQESIKKRAILDKETYWTLTPYGKKMMMQLKAIKREE